MPNQKKAVGSTSVTKSSTTSKLADESGIPYKLSTSTSSIA